MQENCEEENARLRKALTEEHRVLTEVQAAMVEGLKPDTPAEETVERLWEAVGESIDPGEPIEAGERALDAGPARKRPPIGEADADSPSAIPVYTPARTDGS